MIILNQKPLLNVTNWNDLFTKRTTRKDLPWKNKAKISNWINQSNGQTGKKRNLTSFHADPLPVTQGTIENHLIAVQYDTIYFQLIHHENNETYVYAQYNQIIGNRLLAIIKTTSIPRCQYRHLISQS